MMSFYATGEKFQFSKMSNPNPNEPRLASPGMSARINERNYYSQFDHEYKPITKNSQYNKSVYENNKTRYNKDFSRSYFDYSNQSDKATADLKFSHVSNFKLDKTKNYSDLKQFYGGQEGELSRMEGSSVVDRNSFKQQRSSSQDTSQQLDNKLQLRKRNFYVTRNIKLNEFDKQEPISNVGIVSNDNLRWIANSNCKYENLGNTRKEIKRQKQNLSNKDVIGNEKPQFEKEKKKFQLEHPGVYTRYEVKRMQVVDNNKRNNQIEFTTDELRKTEIDIKWKENLPKQSYDHKLVTQKVGDGSKPWIKSLEQKRHQVLKPLKIGRNDKILQPVKQEQYAQLKIGHGKPEILAYKAY